MSNKYNEALSEYILFDLRRANPERNIEKDVYNKCLILIDRAIIRERSYNAKYFAIYVETQKALLNDYQTAAY